MWPAIWPLAIDGLGSFTKTGAAILIMAILGVLVGGLLLSHIVELLSSAGGAAVDRDSAEHHDLSKRAKDLGSAAVMLALVNAAVVWGLTLWPLLKG